VGATILDGIAFAAGMRANAARNVAQLKQQHGIVPGLAVVLVGEDPASTVYVRNKEKQAVAAGMNSFNHVLPADVSESELLGLVDTLNDNPAVHGILIQLPLPNQINAAKVIDRIAPAKDVDGFHISNVGLLASGQPSVIPCTPLGCLLLLRSYLGSMAGMNAVVVGRSNIVGKPMAQLLLSENCTVTVAHSRTEHLLEVCRSADILVAAVGRPEIITGAFIKPGATVIDVGINRVERDGKVKLIGDVLYAEAVQHAGAITPVPGGVGPLTIACLLANTVTACCRSHGLAQPEDLTP